MGHGRWRESEESDGVTHHGDHVDIVKGVMIGANDDVLSTTGTNTD